MGCCVNLADFCRRTGIAHYFRRDPAINFVAPDGRVYQLEASRWLPAPLHLAPSFWRLGFLSFGDRLAISRAMWGLMRTPANERAEDESMDVWLARHRQPRRAIDHFWTTVLVSALGETLDRASVAAARKVFVDGFLSSREASELEIPQAPLAELYGEWLEACLAQHGAKLRLGCAVSTLSRSDQGFTVLTAGESGSIGSFEHAIVAVTWRQAPDLLREFASSMPWLSRLSEIESSPITGVHLWFDRPITDLPHAALIGRLGQWIFNRGRQSEGEAGHYYQIVISASRELVRRDRESIVAALKEELAEIWPAAREARLLHSRVVTEHSSVFSTRPGLERLRPGTITDVPGLFLAGDWTATGWPATMEGAVRSGYLAADAVLQATGRPERFLVPDLRRGVLARLLCAK
jgi:squalene-associated FAD-dependent desaturase